MFGMSFSEICVILIVGVVVLGPDKLPSAMVKIAKYFKIIKKTISDTKANLEEELRIAELKEEAKKYKSDIDTGVSNLRKKLTFEELDRIKKDTQKELEEIKNSFSDEDIKKNNISAINKLNEEEILEDEDKKDLKNLDEEKENLKEKK